MAKKLTKQQKLDLINQAMRLPSISVEFNDKLNKAAKEGAG